MSKSSTTTKARKVFAFELSPPGGTLADELEARGLSATALALALRVPANRITGILNNTRAITPDTAIRLGAYFGNGADFWLRKQMHYDLALAEHEHGEQIRREVAA